MSVTIEEILLIARVSRTPRDWMEVRNHISALVAQARDEEAEACANALERTGDSSAGYFIRDRIRARIAGRKDGGART